MSPPSEAPVGRVSTHLWDPAPGVQVVETHVSAVAFDGERVHKRKKAVRFPFVDLSTSERRELMCRRELQLNRRFSPDVYLGLEEVVDDDGRVVDYAVLMRRMPAERRLATLVREHRDASDCIRQVAHVIAACHAGATTSQEISSVATPEALLDLWDRNLRELAPYVPRPLDTGMVTSVEELADRYLAGRTTLLAERIAAGRIVDGHGDLLAEDIFCLDDGPRVLDGLEFDDRLRWGDVVYDTAFFAMDLDRLGRLDLALAFLDRYGARPRPIHRPSNITTSPTGRWCAPRCRASAGPPPTTSRPRAYLALCHRHLLQGRVRLVVVGGLPGTGKSTLARRSALSCSDGLSSGRTRFARSRRGSTSGNTHRPRSSTVSTRPPSPRRPTT